MRPRRRASSAEGGAHPLVAGGCGVALVEDEVDDGEDGFEALAEVVAARRFEGDVGFGEGFLGAEDALAEGFFGDEEGPRDLGGGEAAGDAQGEGDAAFDGEHGMAGGEDEAEDVVVDDLVEGVVHGFAELLLLVFELAGDFCVLVLEHAVAAEGVDGAALGCGHEPGGGLFGDAFFGPALEGGDEGVLGEFFGDADVAGDAGDAGDEACGLDLPHGLDCFVEVAHRSAAHAAVRRRSAVMLSNEGGAGKDGAVCQWPGTIAAAWRRQAQAQSWERPPQWESLRVWERVRRAPVVWRERLRARPVARRVSTVWGGLRWRCWWGRRGALGRGWRRRWGWGR